MNVWKDVYAPDVDRACPWATGSRAILVSSPEGVTWHGEGGLLSLPLAFPVPRPCLVASFAPANSNYVPLLSAGG